MAKLKDKALIVEFSVGQYSGRKLDKIITQEVADKYGVDATVGRYNKVLIALEKVREIAAIVNEARQYHYRVTVPWGDNNQRLLRNKAYTDYVSEMDKFQRKFNRATKALFKAFPQLVQDARNTLKGMWREADYPTLEQLKGRYYWKCDFNKIEDNTDFRIGLSEAEHERLEENAKKRFAEKESAITTDVFNRLHKAVGHMVEKLEVPIGADGATFRDSLLGNIHELVDLMPILNITDDVGLNETAKNLRDMLAPFEPSDLRKQPISRHSVAENGKAVLKDIEDKMGGIYGRD